jgi:ubiquinone/menaquinone biosynthesis C-methylase UbiE
MGLYSQCILPRLMDWSMSNPLFAQYRSEVLASVQGEILEIGFGTGLNLAYYPYQVERITTIDANSGMQAIAEPRIRDSSIQVEYRVLNSESLPMPDNTFDSVVSTWTLCSIAKVDRAIAEIYRVLKPGGKFFFIEHGLSSDPKVQIWQNRLTPLQKTIADGCHLNRNIAKLVENHFSDVAMEQFYAEGLPKVGGYMYKGVATKDE